MQELKRVCEKRVDIVTAAAAVVAFAAASENCNNYSLVFRAKKKCFCGEVFFFTK